MFHEGASYDDEIENRIGTVTRMVEALRRQVIERKELSKATKLRVINAMVVPTLLYGRETWTLQKTHRSRMHDNGDEVPQVNWCDQTGQSFE